MLKGDHKNWAVWQRAMDLVTETYKLTKTFPASEMYGLSSQMRRASVSIPSNIAEGYRRLTPNDKAYFYRMAFGSASELETQFEITQRLGYLNQKALIKAQALNSEVLKMLWAMTKKGRS
jgi:four helix bundle protein